MGGLVHGMLREAFLSGNAVLDGFRLKLLSAFPVEAASKTSAVQADDDDVPPLGPELESP